MVYTTAMSEPNAAQTPPDNSDELDRLFEPLDESEDQVHGSPEPEDEDVPTRAEASSVAPRPNFRRIYGGAKVPYPGTPEEALRPANEDLAEEDEE